MKKPRPDGEAPARWAARAPRRPQEHFDLKLVPRVAAWREDPDSLLALERIEGEPWVDRVARDEDGVRLRLDDGWIETAGATLEAGGSAEATLSDLARGQRFSVQFWDANATKALHLGHLRNLAIGNALAAALAQAGGQVERRSLISDAGRSMGEAMAGVMASRPPRALLAGRRREELTTSSASATRTTSRPPARSPGRRSSTPKTR